MGAFIVVIGGIAGFGFASAAYAAGLNAAWVFAAYVLGGYGVSSALLLRSNPLRGDAMSRRLEQDMIAMREWQDREACRQEHETQNSLFALLRQRESRA